MSTTSIKPLSLQICVWWLTANSSWSCFPAVGCLKGLSCVASLTSNRTWINTLLFPKVRYSYLQPLSSSVPLFTKYTGMWSSEILIFLSSLAWFWPRGSNITGRGHRRTWTRTKRLHKLHFPRKPGLKAALLKEKHLLTKYQRKLWIKILPELEHRIWILRP